jgi:uncharacterized membrane protein YkvA (DUF1232 family)
VSSNGTYAARDPPDQRRRSVSRTVRGRRCLPKYRSLQFLRKGGHVSGEIAGRLKEWARVIKRDVHALYLASRDPRVPWYAKALAVAVAAYALSPIDLIPDFIPVLGYLDDLILLPLGILLVVWLIPPEIMAEHRELAAASQEHPHRVPPAS